jgi:ClpP class serine protease
MSLMSEYINKGFGPIELQEELSKLISQYNTLRETYLLVYAAATDKTIPDIALAQSDFYKIRDLLSSQKGHSKVDVYLETPGGRGETAEEIVIFLHQNFKTVSFVVSGEAKSAGTIIVLGGNEILMTETGSLGPIDAQIKVGRSVVSAYDYIEWVEEKRKEAKEKDTLNPFDAKMIAQITPGELGGALHSMNFAKDLVVLHFPKKGLLSGQFQ